MTNLKIRKRRQERLREPKSPWNEKLVIDGGMGTELYALGAKEIYGSHQLWSAQANHESPDLVTEAHRRFINAGADVIITNTYKCNPGHVTRILEWPIEKSHELVKQTVQCAVTAAKESKKRIYIGGSIGPYSGELACPSGPYNPEYLKSLSIEKLAAWLEPLYQDLNSNDDVDFLAIETVPGLKEAAAHFSLLMSKYRKNAYLVFVCKDGKTCAGESFEDVAKFLRVFCPENLKAIGVNCCSADDVTKFGEIMKRYLPNMPLICYPNTGERWQRRNSNTIVGDAAKGQSTSRRGSVNWEGNLGSWSGNPKNIVTHVESWLELGYSWIGGCCRVTPDDISEIRDIFDKKLLKTPETKKDKSSFNVNFSKLSC